MSTYYTIMSMIDGFKSFINLAVMVLTIVASWIMYAKAGEHGWAAIVPFYINKIHPAILAILATRYPQNSFCFPAILNFTYEL